MDVYLDNMASTPVDPRVVSVMAPLLIGPPGNPHATIHHFGAAARDVVERARTEIANAFRVKPSQVFFCPSATAANNLAIMGIAKANEHKGRHILVSAIEHVSIIEPALELARSGFTVDFIPATEKGIIEPCAVKARLRPDSILLSVMAVNNEIGTIQPLKEIREVLEDNHVFFHCDAVQAIGKIPIDELLYADLITISSHKVYGPKGAASLIFLNKDKVKMKPILFGGGQEGGLWPGTVNVLACAGFGRAVEIGVKEQAEESKRIYALSEKLCTGVFSIFERSWRNGDPTRIVPHCVSITFSELSGETIFSKLTSSGIAVAFGSACASSNINIKKIRKPSHVLSALGLSPHEARSTLRFGLGRFTTEQEIDYITEILNNIK